MLKKILSYGVVEGISKGLNKLVVLILPFFITSENYGVLGLLIAIELVLPLISLLGLERAALRFYHFKSKIYNFESTIFKSVSLLSGLFFIFFIILILLGKQTCFEIKVYDILLVIVLVYLQGTIQIFTNMIRVEENHKKYFNIRILYQFSKLIFVLFLTYLRKDYYGYLYGSIFSSIIVFIPLLKSYSKLNEPFNKKTFLILINFSWPFILHGVSGNLLGNADKFIINNYMSKSDVGIYSLAYAIGSSMIFTFVGISIYIEPLIYKAKNIKERTVLMQKFNLYGLIAGLLFYLSISIVFEFIVPHYNLGEYENISKYVPFVAIGFLLYPFYLSSNWELIYQKKGKTIASLSILSALANILLNIFFIPKFGLMGAVFNSFLTYFIQIILFIFISQNQKLNLSILVTFIGGVLICLAFLFDFSSIFTSLFFTAIILFYYFISKSNYRFTN